MNDLLERGQEHILVCLSSSPSNEKIIKAAAQMAHAFGGRFTALYVKTPTSDAMSRENRDRLQKHIRLSEDMGAEIATVYGEDVAEQIIEFARVSKITKLVVGRSHVVGGRLFKRQTLTDKIIKAAPGLEVHVLPDTEVKHPYRFYGLSSAIEIPSLRQWIWFFAILLVSSAFGFLFHRSGISHSNTLMVYMLGTLITAVVTKNYLCSGLFSLASVVIFNFFFTEPRFSFVVHDAEYPITFAIMLVASLLTGTLANRLATSAKLSANAAYRTNIMLETNQLLQNCDNEDDMIATMAHQLERLLSRPIVVYPATQDGLGEPLCFPSEGGRISDEMTSEAERAVALWVYQNRRRAGAGTDRKKKARGVYFAVRTDDAAFCVVGIEVGHKPPEPFENSILLSILGETALTIENLRHTKEKEEIALLAENEQLRADLLRAISHDLRTPLTSISGNAENLLANFEQMDPDTRRGLLTDVNDDAEWLISLVENLLSVSRISEGKMNIHMSAQLVDEVTFEALRHVTRKASEHHIETDFGEELLLACMDARLISQVIINLVDNAVKYTPPGSHIRITGEDMGEEIRISVSDDGAGIPDEQKSEVFRMFYTGRHKVVDCRRSLGLGLSLCRSIVTAHGGTMTLTDNHPHGCIFAFTLKKSEVGFDA